MPVVGFHQARRPRQSPASLLRRELSWPRPGGIAVSVIGAALIFSGAVALGPASDSSPPSAVARSSLPSTTPGPDQEQPPSSAAAHDSVTTAPSSGPAPTSTNTLPPTNATAPLIAGAGANAPIQALFAAGNGLPKNTALWDISDPDSPLVFVNKRNPLIPADYAPADLVVPSVLSGSAEPVLVRAEAAAAVELMFAAAAAQGVIITVKSSYRSFETQVSVYNGYVVSATPPPGLETISAPPPDTSVELNWLNLFYAAEWVIFAGFAVFLWWRLVRDVWERERAT